MEVVGPLTSLAQHGVDAFSFQRLALCLETFLAALPFMGMNDTIISCTHAVMLCTYLVLNWRTSEYVDLFVATAVALLRTA